MRHDDDRHLLPERVERLTDQMLAAHVERTGRFVEDQYVGVLHQGPGDDQPLLLAAAEMAPLLPHLPLVALSETGNVVVQIGET